MLQQRPGKGCDEKDAKSKECIQGLRRNAVDHIKKFDNDDPGCKTFFRPQNIESRKMFCGLDHYQQF